MDWKGRSQRRAALVTFMDRSIDRPTPCVWWASVSIKAKSLAAGTWIQLRRNAKVDSPTPPPFFIL